MRRNLSTTGPIADDDQFGPYIRVHLEILPLILILFKLNILFRFYGMTFFIFKLLKTTVCKMFSHLE